MTSTLLEISAVGPQYASTTINTKQPNGDVPDPTGDVVQFYFVPPYTWPTASDVPIAGSWWPGGPPYVARVLVSSVARGTYSVFVQPMDMPEQPILPCGTITILEGAT